MPGHRKTLRHIHCPGHAHELTFSCHHQWPLLSHDRPRLWMIEALAAARLRWQFEIWAYVIMPEHVHVLIFPREPVHDVAVILKSIKQPVARRATEYLRRRDPHWLHRLRVERPGGRSEYRFWKQGGGYDRNLVESDAIWASINYLHDNPVRRGIAKTSVDWRWSSARAYAGLDDVVLPIDPPRC